MQVSDLSLSGVKLIRPRVFRDDRGYFLETFSTIRYAQAGIEMSFVQDNLSQSYQGTIRRLHYQSRPGQAKLVRAATGRIWDVVVDVRPMSAAFGQWEGTTLDARELVQLFVPVGFAHGFCVLSEVADVVYKVSSPYNPATECSIRYNDPELAVSWPLAEPRLSERDLEAEPFATYRARVLS